MSKRTVTYYIETDASGAVKGWGDVEKAKKGVEQQSERTGTASVALGNILADVAMQAAQFMSRLPGIVYELSTSVEETAAKYNTVFGPAVDGVNRFLENNRHAMGLTRMEAQGFTAQIGDLVQGLGFTQEESANTAIEVAQLAGDMASFNNVPIEQTINAITSGLTGEREALKTLGVVIRETDVQTRALAQTGKENADALTAQERAAATMSLITERATFAVGDLARTQDSAANRGRAFMAQLREIGEQLAVNLLPSVGALITQAQQFIQTDMFQGMVDGAMAAGDAINFVLTNLDAFIPILAGAAGGLATLVMWQYRDVVAKKLQAMWASRVAAAQALATGGIGLLVAALGALVAILATNNEAFEGFSLILNGVWLLFQTIIGNLPVFARDALLVLFEVWKIRFEAMYRLAKGILTAIQEDWKSFAIALTMIMRGQFEAGFSVMADIAKRSAQSITSEFTGLFDGVQDSIENLTTNTDFGPANSMIADGGAKMADALVNMFSQTLGTRLSDEIEDSASGVGGSLGPDFSLLNQTMSFLDLLEQTRQDHHENELERQQERRDTAQTVFEESREIMSGLMSLRGTIHRSEISDLEEEKSEMMDYYDERLSRENITEAERDRLRAERQQKEQQLQDKINEEKRKAAEAEKNWAATEVVMQTGVAIMKAAPNPLLMAAMAIQGAIQLATIQAQPLPKYERGGWLSGRRHSEGGIMIEAESDEFVVNRESARLAGPLLEAINASPSFASNIMNSIPSFEYGGSMSSSLPSPSAFMSADAGMGSVGRSVYDAITEAFRNNLIRVEGKIKNREIRIANEDEQDRRARTRLALNINA